MNLLMLLFITLFLFSCTSQVLQIKCRQRAVMAALVMGEKYPVRIISGPTKSGVWHSQAQAYRDGWKWLDTDRRFVFEDAKDDFIPEREHNVKEYLKWQFKGIP